MNLVVAIFVFVLGVLAAAAAAYAGLQMTMLRSVAGNTVAEAYYNAVGLLTLGVSAFIFAVTFGVAYLVDQAGRKK